MLCSGDYHRFHAPAEFEVHEGRRFAGDQGERKQQQTEYLVHKYVGKVVSKHFSKLVHNNNNKPSSVVGK